jgi:hypothetical protein
MEPAIIKCIISVSIAVLSVYNVILTIYIDIVLQENTFFIFIFQLFLFITMNIVYFMF